MALVRRITTGSLVALGAPLVVSRRVGVVTVRRWGVCAVLVVTLTGLLVQYAHSQRTVAVEGTYSYSDVNTSLGVRFPNRVWWTQWFSDDTIKQGEPLEFRATQKYEGWGWCFSSDEYDIRQTGLNVRTAYSPRGRTHEVTGRQGRLQDTSYRSRAWREFTNCGAPPGSVSCPEGTGTCPYYGTQFHELTGTVPGSDTARLEPGCYLLETDWEYGPSPIPRPPVSVDQRESGSLPRFCVQAADRTTTTPTSTTSGAKPGTSTTPTPSSRSAVQVSDFGVSCGTTRFQWHYLTEEPTFVQKGEYACVVLLSNQLSRELIDLAYQNRWTLAEAYARTHWKALAKDAPQNLAPKLVAPILSRIFPVAAQTIARLNVLYTAPSVVGYGVVKPLAVGFVLSQYTQQGACAQFIVDVDRRDLKADWNIVYNPRVSQPGGSFASVWQMTGGKAVRRYLPLRCGLNGRVLHGRGDAVFRGGTTVLVAP